MSYEITLSALADPTRRRLFETLRGRPRAVTELCAELPVSQPAVSQHLKVLREAGLVEVRREGNRRIYSVSPRGLGELRAWVESMWDEALTAFAAGSGEEKRS